MAVYVDDAIWDWRGRKWCHLLADDNDELHRFAAVLGLHRSSYQGPPKTSAPHYDLTAYERRRAIALGARVCDRSEIVAIYRQVRAKKECMPQASNQPLVPAQAGTQGQAARPGSLTLDSRVRGNERKSSRHRNALAARRG